MALTDGLIAKYDLNTDANDSVGSNNGTITGNPVHQTINARDVLTFDGNDYVTLPASLNTITDGDYTMSAWVKIPSHNDYPGIVTINGQGILMFQGQVGYMTNGNNVVNYVGNSLSTNQWYHVLLTKSDSTYSLYVDGVLKSGSGSDAGWGLSGVTAIARGYSTYQFNGSIVTEITKLDVFYEAENYHQDYYKNNPNQPYCRFVIKPKLDNFFKKY